METLKANISNELLLNSLENRYAVKKFDAQKKIDAKTWQTLEKSLVLTPSSYGLQPWKFMVITNLELRQQLTKISWNQKQVEDCSHYVVFLGKTSVDENYIQQYIDAIAATRNIAASSMDPYKKMMVGDLVNGPRSKVIAEWAARQCYIALGSFMTTAALLGVDTCPMEGIQPDLYDDALDLKNSGYKTLVTCAAGYHAADDHYKLQKKVRFNLDQMIIRK